jgi:hypothetical protein
MSRKITANYADTGQDSAVQFEVMLPLRPPRRDKSAGARPGAPANGRPRLPRITRLMALAIKFQGMIDRGEVEDYADLARLGYVTAARITQIMNLLNLAPCIQEEILTRDAGLPRVFERQLRTVTSQVLWREQNRRWQDMMNPPVPTHEHP